LDWGGDVPQGHDDVLLLLQCLCDAALDDVIWGRFLEALCRNTGSVEADLFVVDPLAKRYTSCIVCDLERGWIGQCDPEPGAEPVWTELETVPATGTDVPLPPPLLEPNACPVGVAVALGSAPPDPRLWVTELWQYDDRQAFLALRRQTDGAFQGEEEQRLEAVLPFLRRAFLVAYRLETGERRNAMLLRAVEHGSTGVVLLEAHGQIVYANGAAREILTQEDGLLRDGSRLRALRESDNEALQALLHGAIGPAPSAQRASGGVISVPRPSGRTPYSVVAVPVSLRPTVLRRDEAVATVFISDPMTLCEVDGPHIRQLYHLTPREVRLAVLLAGGTTVADAAQALGIAEKTTRIHLQGLFRKTGTRRQVDLVRLLLASPGPARTGDRGAERG